MANTPLNAELLRTRLAEAGLPWQVSYHPSSGSTQDMALALIQTHGPGHWLVVADQQEAGRGRMQRTWLSDPGDLAATWTLPLELPAERWGKIGLVAGLIAAEAIREVTGDAPRVKWPNDLFFLGAKVGGVLGDIRTTPAGTVALVGIGINLVAKDPSRLPEAPRYPIGALEGGEAPALRLDLLVALSRLLIERLCWAMAEHDAAVQAWWDAATQMQGAEVQLAQPDGGTLQGTVLGLQPSGALRLRTADGAEMVVQAGDVSLVGGYNAAG